MSLCTAYFMLCNFRSRTPTFRKTVTIPTPRTPTPFKNALAAQEKMHGPLKMEVSARFHTLIYVALSFACFTAVERLVSAAAAGFSRRRHTRSSEAGDRSGHLQQSRPARLQTVETDGKCRLHIKYFNLLQVETLHLKGKSRFKTYSDFRSMGQQERYANLWCWTPGGRTASIFKSFKSS